MPSRQDNIWQRDVFVLASGSGTRRALLKQAGLDFIADAPDVDEDSLKRMCKAENQSAQSAAQSLALAKARKISAERKGMLVLGCDQILECETRWLDKAGNKKTAQHQLEFLSGKTHHLVTAAVLVRDGKLVWETTQTACLTMRPLSSDFIQAYLAQMGDHLFGHVGCYALEGLGSHLFEKVAGDHFVILGLPLIPFLSALREQGLLIS